MFAMTRLLGALTKWRMLPQAPIRNRHASWATRIPPRLIRQMKTYLGEKQS